MTEDYQDYLAGQLLSERNINIKDPEQCSEEVSSSAHLIDLKTENFRMLYEFHRLQNSQKPGSLHATYLLMGTRASSSLQTTNGVADDNEDTPMQNGPYRSSPVHSQEYAEGSAKQRLVTLVGEEHLENAKKHYAELSSLHVYSLEPSAIKNLQVLSSVTQQILTDFASDDPLSYNKTYGIVQNPNVKRRTGARPPVVTSNATPSSKTASQSTQIQAAKSGVKISASLAFATSKRSPESKDEPSTERKKPGKSAPAAAKKGKSDLFKAFAKTQPKVKREDTSDSAASHPKSRPETPTSQQDVLMADDEDEEGEPSEVETKAESTGMRDARLAREAKLRKMMEEDDDEPMENAPTKSEPEPEEEEEEEKEGGEEAETSTPIDAPKKEAEEEKPTVTVSGGRRRGRRKVMKKKTVKDVEGYLVTKEEPAWESFSEDEPTPAPKPKVFSSSAPVKGKKGGGKSGGGGGGNIMNFFGKK
ncbi:hypothetical protein MMC10_005327 [Thelotrema lepadinum]|nr:hypothetical protein [Thelotrema lepadinum]